MADCLPTFTETFGNSKPVKSFNSLKRLEVQLLSLTDSVIARYSASVLEMTTFFWGFDLQIIDSPPKVIRVPEVDLYEDESPTKSYSE